MKKLLLSVLENRKVLKAIYIVSFLGEIISLFTSETLGEALAWSTSLVWTGTALILNHLLDLVTEDESSK